MKTFILLTRLISEETHPSFSLQKKETDVVENIEKICPSVKWVKNYTIFGPWDYVDIFNAPDEGTAIRVSTLVRYYGGAHTELWPAVEWQDFKNNMQDLAQKMEK